MVFDGKSALQMDDLGVPPDSGNIGEWGPSSIARMLCRSYDNLILQTTDWTSEIAKTSKVFPGQRQTARIYWYAFLQKYGAIGLNPASYYILYILYYIYIVMIYIYINYITHMLHVWYIYLNLGDLCGANVGKYSIHGAYGEVLI